MFNTSLKIQAKQGAKFNIGGAKHVHKSPSQITPMIISQKKLCT